MRFENTPISLYHGALSLMRDRVFALRIRYLMSGRTLPSAVLLRHSYKHKGERVTIAAKTAHSVKGSMMLHYGGVAYL
jgi:hypothetical protein